VTEKLQAEGEKIGAEGWKWIATAVDLPWGVTNGMREIDGVPVARTAEEDARLAALEAEAEQIEAEWSDDPDVPEEVHARMEAIDAEIAALVERPMTFDADEMARAGAFISIEVDGSLCIERGYVRPEDEPVVDVEGDAGVDDDAGDLHGGEDDGTDASAGSPAS